ncbi:hypothetical protein [Mycobacterium shigaense]|uniref:Uncharacterized protein n=1 Tax=Mycobacterium shigaense TaxID=722731 RepID=A0A1Z4EHX4_9MYCO|nr:hypothetical protein [Mycobacterium shigaense]MEA1123756.1 hypothetical protein [Mycobacterium shigaense]BAX92569.1 hypothetical protein MSG_02425 [Mycobacterium shigaense]
MEHSGVTPHEIAPSRYGHARLLADSDELTFSEKNTNGTARQPNS